MSEPLTIEGLLLHQIAVLEVSLGKQESLLKRLLEESNERVTALEADRTAWETERRYLVDSLMELTGAARPMTKPGEPEKPVEELPVVAGPRRLSWHQVEQAQTQQSAARKQQHLKQLAELAAARRAGGA